MKFLAFGGLADFFWQTIRGGFLSEDDRNKLIALLHRLGLEYQKPTVIPRKLDEEKQKTFIAYYENLLNSLGDDEAVLFGGPRIRPTLLDPPAVGLPNKRHSRSSKRAGANASTVMARSSCKPGESG